MKYPARIILLLMLLPLLSFFHQKEQQKEILIGLIPEMNVFKQMKRFQPLADYITRQTGIKIHITILSRYGNIIERFTSEKMDGAFFGSFTGRWRLKNWEWSRSQDRLILTAHLLTMDIYSQEKTAT